MHTMGTLEPACTRSVVRGIHYHSIESAHVGDQPQSRYRKSLRISIEPATALFQSLMTMETGKQGSEVLSQNMKITRNNLILTGTHGSSEREPITKGNLNRIIEAIKFLLPVTWTLAHRVPNGKELTPAQRDQLGLTRECLSSQYPEGSSEPGVYQRSDISAALAPTEADF